MFSSIKYGIEQLALVAGICLALASCSKPVPSEEPRPEYCRSGLPLLYIDTSGSAPVDSREEYVTASFTLDGNEYSGRIRGRGNTTWACEKKPYKFRLDCKASLMGMPANRDWVLLASYGDKTMLRNALAFEMSRILGMEYTPRYAYVEVVLNGDFLGNYMLCEKIEIARERLNIGRDSWLMEIDARAPEGDDRFFNLPHVEQPVVIKDGPEGDCSIDEFMNSVDSVLFSDDFADPDNGYRSVVDAVSFADWYIVNEVALNNDAIFYSSCFIFVQKGGKLKMGPVWDFDIAFGNENYAGNSGVEGRWLHQVQWFARMKQDPWFRALLQQRFDYLYAHRRELLDFIKESSLRLSPSASLNDERWDLFSRQVLYNPVALGSYDAEVQRLESWLDSRLNWMALNDWL